MAFEVTMRRAMNPSDRSAPDDDERWIVRRRLMVQDQLRERGIRDERVLAAMGRVPRHMFVPETWRSAAYDDTPLPIGYGQTISQPLMVATMLEAAAFEGDERVLEVGAGCGYQAALLGELAHEVFTVEIIPDLARLAAENLERTGYENVLVVQSDGSLGHRESAPYDVILVAAAAPTVPEPLVDQLAVGGRLLIPVGSSFGQTLERVTRLPDGRIDVQRLGGCAFVPLVGAYGS
jgi:protein-L-isoaspartate(D-aspartate) O-methyltransferase